MGPGRKRFPCPLRRKVCWDELTANEFMTEENTDLVNMHGGLVEGRIFNYGLNSRDSRASFLGWGWGRKVSFEWYLWNVREMNGWVDRQ